jgi:NADPH:quinone reductase-like Zn-dependent oxidoreductase
MPATSKWPCWKILQAALPLALAIWCLNPLMRVDRVATDFLLARGQSPVSDRYIFVRMTQEDLVHLVHVSGQRSAIADVMDRAQLSAPGKPLAKERWAGVVDSVGSHTLANACACTKYGGVVTACGLAQGMDFPGSVAPFILRGVTLAGIDSVMAPRALREAAWARLAQDLDPLQLERITREVGLADAIALGSEILAGQVRGRVVVNVNR